MNISLLRLKNCLGAENVEFKPGKITIIQGKGKQGKTSILESIERTLYNTGKRPQFVYGGADKAEAYLVLDDGTEIRKSINQEGKVSSVKISRDGVSSKSPETYLKSLVGERQLNPVEFINETDKEQTETILSIIPIEVTREDVSSWIGEEVEADYSLHGLKVCKQIEDKLYAIRTDINKEKDMLKADVENLGYKIPASYDVEAWRNISLSEKYEKISEANKINLEIQKNKSIVENADFKIESLREKCKSEIAVLRQSTTDTKQTTINKIAELKKQMELLEKDLQQVDGICDVEIKNITEKYTNLANNVKEEVSNSQKHINENPIIDILPLEEEHKNAELMKSYVRIADELKTKKEEHQAAVKDSEKLTAQIETIRSKPQELLSKAEMPISNLSVKDGNILINNLPIKNLCGTEKIEFAVEVAKATSRDLKVILVDGLESLCQEDLETFIEKCKDDEFQYIMTRVTDGNLAIINENGELLNN